jgi:hypothetical protein
LTLLGDFGIYVSMARPLRIEYPGAYYHVMKGITSAIGGFLELAGHRMKAGAEHFHRDPVGISQGMQKLEVRLRRGVALQGAVKEIEETLTRNRKRKYFITYAWESDRTVVCF